ncbi:hypothetical protein TCE0_050r18384 [Talaromyces pinophilus]|uniref:Peptidyl-prolyl cis-trans isomerase n=1 Tax=Talaromyces pinophilus TaxID=128442 RepID=A0A0B8N5T1_TALPI|nr:hypothetical protein TCE0_050r18384 [Talaromyces pinophilus]
MSVLLETSLGDLVIDLLVDVAPKACENFLKLCKVKYYNFSPVHSVQKNFTFQTGDPIGPGSADSDGGSSIWGLLKGPMHKTFAVDMPTKLKHAERGTVSMATVPSPKDPDERLAGSQFIITLDDPYDDPPGLEIPPESPLPSKAQLATVRIADDEELDENMDEEAMERLRREREARAQALTLEMVGDLPFADVKPPENVLFVCKLNPVTQDEDLNLIFSRFGPILSCEVIRDKKTGDSLQYAFIEFENQKDCEQAYFKMEGVLIDDHRIHVDFSQSILGGKLQSKSGKEEDSVAYRVSNENANTAQLKIVAGLTGTAWFLIKTRCAAHRQIEVKSRRGRGHTAAVAALTGEVLQDVMMTSGVMTGSKMGTGIVTEIETEIVIVIVFKTSIPPTEETTVDDDDKPDVLNV